MAQDRGSPAPGLPSGLLPRCPTRHSIDPASTSYQAASGAEPPAEAGQRVVAGISAQGSHNNNSPSWRHPRPRRNRWHTALGVDQLPSNKRLSPQPASCQQLLFAMLRGLESLAIGGFVGGALGMIISAMVDTTVGVSIGLLLGIAVSLADFCEFFEQEAADFPTDCRNADGTEPSSKPLAKQRPAPACTALPGYTAGRGVDECFGCSW
jgi:hypothetical protein